MGFFSSVVAGVWVGFDQPASIGPSAYASRYDLPIWAEFITRGAPLRPPTSFTHPPSIP